MEGHMEGHMEGGMVAAIADARRSAGVRTTGCPLRPQNAKCRGSPATSQKGHFRTLANSVVQSRPKASLILGLSAKVDSWR